MKSHLIEIPLRNKTTYDRRLDIVQNGEDNKYPTRMERLINGSPTAKQSAGVYAKFIRGQGFDVGFDVEVGRWGGVKYTPDLVLQSVAKSISYHKGFYLHIGYNLAGEITSIVPLPFRYCRFGKQDSNDYSGKIRVYDNWDLEQARSVRKSDIRDYDIYNPKAVQAQIAKAGGIEKYGGQVYFGFMEIDSVYPLSTIDVAQNDAYAEFQMGVFKRQVLMNDFITDKQIIRHAPMREDDLEQFKENLKATKGADNAGNHLTIEDDFNEETPNGRFKVDVLKSGLDDKIFESWEKSCSNNIRRCFANVPQILIDEVEGKLGNSSGEGIRAAFDYYNQQTEEERQFVASSLDGLFRKFYRPIATGYEIMPLSYGN